VKYSVCVPYWKRQGALDKMVEQYDRLYSDFDLEYSICDDGSPKPAIVPRMTRSGRLCVMTRLSEKKHALNPCVPINKAVEKSTGDIIILTNAEVVHLEAILPEMRGLLTDATSYVIARCWDTRGKWIAGPETDYSIHGPREPCPPGGHMHFLTMLRRELWEAAGGFDEEYRNGQGCDDNDWLWRLYAVGAQFKTTLGHVQHAPSKSVRWGLPHNRALFHRKWPSEMRTHLIAAGGGLR